MAHAVPTPSDLPLAIQAQGSKTLAAVLLAASLSALLVIADQLIDSWTHGNLLFAWVALWTVAFAGLAILARPLRRIASALALSYARWLEARRTQRMEDELWEYAQHDQRIMAELEAAYSRQSR